VAKIDCKLIINSNSRHLQQLYTGFFLLSKMGLIKLKQVIKKGLQIDDSKPQHLRDSFEAHLDLVLNADINVHYDTHDSREINESSFHKSDFYFKRSFSKKRILNDKKNSTKLQPLGLYYPVHASTLDKYAIQRSFFLERGVSRLGGFKSNETVGRFKFLPNVANMWSVPDCNIEAAALFMVAAWDPLSQPDRSMEKIQEREFINEMRANCIKLLRKEFGERFYGGFIHTDFAKKRYPDCLMPDNKLSSKKNYIKLLKSYPICVATTGLHGSIGAKLAEYVAFSKAIVSEKLNYFVPGNFENGNNFLEFSKPEECVNRVERLFSDKELRIFLMRNNEIYYNCFSRPDSMVLNTIRLVLSERCRSTQMSTSKTPYCKIAT
jgi:hypothetical protein